MNQRRLPDTAVLMPLSRKVEASSKSSENEDSSSEDIVFDKAEHSEQDEKVGKTRQDAVVHIENEARDDKDPNGPTGGYELYWVCDVTQEITMSHMQSPSAWCDAAHTMVRTDQTLEQCALEHTCPPGRLCPLGGCLSNIHAANRRSHSPDQPEWCFSSAPNFLDL